MDEQGLDFNSPVPTPTEVVTGLHAPRGVVYDEAAGGARLLISIGDGNGGVGRIVTFDLTSSAIKNAYYIPGSVNNPGPGIIDRFPGSNDLYVPFANGFVDRISLGNSAGTLVHRYKNDTNGSTNLTFTSAVVPDTKTGLLFLSEYSSRSVLTMTIDSNAPNFGGDISFLFKSLQGGDISPAQMVFGPCRADGTDGQPCDDGDLCTTNDVCQAGSCVGTPPPAPCTAIDECHEAGSCQPATGLCSEPVATNGTSCGEGVCQDGVCELGQAGAGGVGGGAGEAGAGGSDAGAGGSDAGAGGSEAGSGGSDAGSGGSDAGAGGDAGAAGDGGSGGSSGEAGAGGTEGGQAGDGGQAGGGQGGMSGTSGQGGSSAGQGGAGQGGAGQGGAGQGGKAGSGGTGGSGGSGSTATPSEDSGDDGGCGCRTAGGDRPAGGWVAALLLGVALRLRRRR